MAHHPGYRPEARKGNTVAEAFIEAAASIGGDGKGKNALSGYFKRLARDHPRQMISFIGKILQSRTPLIPEKQKTDDELMSGVDLDKLSPQETTDLYFELLALPLSSEKGNTVAEMIIEAAVLIGEDGKGKNGLAGYFKRLARDHPRQMRSLAGKILQSPTPRVAGKEGATGEQLSGPDLSKLSFDELKQHYDKLMPGRRRITDGAAPSTQ
jgi:hypothetical protein